MKNVRAGKLTREEKHSPDYSGRRISREIPELIEVTRAGWPPTRKPEGRWAPLLRCLIDPGLLLV